MADIETSKNIFQEKYDALVSKREDISTIFQPDMEDQDFVWGIKQNANNYKTVFINNEVYALNDCVRCRSGLELDYIGKIMKLSEENGQKFCTLRWFFRPTELPTSLKGLDHKHDTKELFLAFGEGIGVENKNLLVSCYNISNFRNINNVENVVPLRVIIDKCKILCTAEDDFNDLPSNEHLNACEFYFNKAFNCDTLEIIGLDGVVDAIGAQKVYNKKEWLYNKIDKNSTSMITSPKKTLCQSFGSYTLPINPSNLKSLPLLHCNSPPSITEQSTERKIKEKRKRNTVKEEMLLPKKVEKTKKIKLSHASKKSKLCVINNVNEALAIQEIHTPQSMIDLKNAISIFDVVQTFSTSQLSLSRENFGPSFNEMLSMVEHDKYNGQFKTSMSSLINVPIHLEHTIEGIGNNADDIHVTCEGFPMQDLLEPLERSESSTSKLKNDENNSKLTIVQNGASETNEPIIPKKTNVSLVNDKKVASKAKQTTQSKNLSDIASNITLKKPTTKKLTRCSTTSKTQNKNKKARNTKNEVEQVSILNSKDSQNINEDSIKDENKPCKSSIITTKSSIFDEISKDISPSNVESLENGPTSIEIKDVSPKRLETNHAMQIMESTSEVWEKEINKAIYTKRILILYNLDLDLHPTDLEEALSKIFKIKCEVRMAISFSLLYNTTSALLKLMTSSIAEEVLQSICENCLVIRGRTVIASLYEDSELEREILEFPGHINIQLQDELFENYDKEFTTISHVAQCGTIEFTFGLRWKLLQEQHELQWQLLKELHANEYDILNKEITKQPRSKKTK